MDDDLKKSVLKTGTTILGIICKDGVVMAADNQMTAGTIVMGKKEEKVFKVNNDLVISGCGIAADIHRVPKLLAAELKLKELRSKSKPSVAEAASLLSNLNYSGIRQPSMIPQQAGFLLAGFNKQGKAELYSVEPAGGTMKVEEYDANFGSGMPFVLGYLERNYRKDITTEEGIKLATESIKASTQRDVGSGYGLDIYTLKNGEIKKVVSQVINSDFTDK